MRFSKKKDKFAALPPEFKDSLASASEEEIRKRIAEIALNQVALMQAKSNDLDLQERLEAAKMAGAIYREGSKENKLKIEFCQRVLEDRGRDAGSFAEP